MIKFYFLLLATLLVVGANAWIMDIETEKALQNTKLSDFVNEKMKEYHPQHSEMTPAAAKQFAKYQAGDKKDNLMTDAERRKAYKELFATK